jgi:signal transduction histidine kinase
MKRFRLGRFPGLGAAPAALLRPQSPPFSVGVAVAAAFIIAETLLICWFQHAGSERSFRSLLLLGVLVVSALWPFRLALATTFVSAAVYFYFHLDQNGPIVADDFLSLFVFLPIALLANILGRQSRLRATEAEKRRQEADVAASLASRLAQQQMALRRVATLVARGVEPAQIYPAAMLELSRGLNVDHVALLEFRPGVASVIVGGRDQQGNETMYAGEQLSLDGDSVAALIHRDGRPARIDSFAGATGSAADRIRSLGIVSAVGTPILVDGRIWGAIVVGSAQAEPLPAGTERRIADFARLVSTAIANAETRAELAASRIRIVAAADQARQRFERDLHDGAQQHVVSLGLQLRTAETLVGPDQHELRRQISLVRDGLNATAAELRELSHGIHPAVLSRGGLGPAIRALARRSALPVGLELDVKSPMSEHVGVGAYYVVAEALTNAAKHSHASEVSVHAAIDDGNLCLVISDTGVGGAVVGGGSGLIGLKDRIEALGGHLDIDSPVGRGTTLTVIIPLDTPPPATA